MTKSEHPLGGWTWKWLKLGRAVTIEVTLFLLPALACAGDAFSLGSGDFSLSSFQNIEIDYQGKLSLASRWDIITNNVPVRYYTAFAFDETRNKALAFGGRNANDFSLGDTWLWSAVTGVWIQKNPSGPPSARFGHALVWMGDWFLLFGGSSSADTWTYDIVADTWAQVTTAINPPANLFLPAMTYDSHRNKVILIGGGQGNTNTWIFNVAASSWSSYNLSPAPSDRIGAVMAYDRANQRAVLFGGKVQNISTYLNETWIFDPVNLTWTEVSPSTRPAAGADGGMAYDTRNSRVLIYGGWTGNLAYAVADTNYYDFNNNTWIRATASNNENPPGRFGNAMAYDTFNHRALVFAGKVSDGSLVSSLWQRTLRSSGTAISNSKNVSYVTTTPITWGSLSISFIERPPSTDVLLRVASSPDGTTFDSFRGPDGSTSTFYSFSSTPLALWSGHNNHHYLKFKTEFISNNPPQRPRLSDISLTYNQAPTSPILNSPANGSRINKLSPVFNWQISADPDGPGDFPFLYHLQVATSADFALPIVSKEDIPMSVDVSYATGLASGLWYWRARAKDNTGFYGDYSVAFSVFNDTITPPNPVTQMTAAIGPGNGKVALKWVFPGDDKGDASGGRYRIRYSMTDAILTEALWASLSGVEQSGLLSATSGQILTTVVGGLETATTYYLAIKTEDELGNLSALSNLSPYAMTNASPTVTLTAPIGGELFIGTMTVRWQASDPNPGDSLSFSLWFSSNSGAGFDTLIASGLAPSSTPAGSPVQQPQGTFYVLDTRGIPNSFNNRLKIVASDLSGLQASAITPADFRTDNANEPPQVWLTSAPAAGSKVQGKFAIAWGYFDPNSFQQVAFELWLSSDSGAAYTQIPLDVKLTSLTLDTLSFFAWWGFRNVPTYRIKVKAKDSGIPSLSSEIVSDVFEAITRSVESFSLVKPLEEDFPTIFDLAFAWQAPANLGGSIVYTLRYSTEPLFTGGTSYSVLTANGFRPILGSLAFDQTYYWQVTARNSFNEEVSSNVEKFIVSRIKAKSPGRQMQVEVFSGMPANTFISIQDANASYQTLLANASLDAKGDRLIQLISEPTWHIELRDFAGNTMAPSSLTAGVTFVYADQDADGQLDSTLVPVDQLKIARLNESLGRWEPVSASQTLERDRKSVTTTVEGFSVFTLLASPLAIGKLFGVTNFPNPFTPGKESTRIRYVLTENATVTIRIYTLLGDLVKTFQFGVGLSGGTGTGSGFTNEVLWDGKNDEGVTVANGMYLAEIKAEFSSGGQESQIRKIGVVK